MKKAEQTAQTKQALVRSLIAVGRKKTLAKVSVADLTRASGISRGTFYLHYLDKDDLVAKTEAALLKEFTDCLDFGMEHFDGSQHPCYRPAISIDGQHGAFN